MRDDSFILALLHQTTPENAYKILASKRLVNGFEFENLGLVQAEPSGRESAYENLGLVQGESSGSESAHEKSTSVEKKELTGGQTSGHWTEGGQFIGVYTRILFQEDAKSVVNSDDQARNLLLVDDKLYPAWVVLVLSPTLLNRQDYHANVTDQNGIVSPLSYGPDHLVAMHDKWLSRIQIPGRKNQVANELIFHHHVDLDTGLAGIWILGDDKDHCESRISRFLAHIPVDQQASIASMIRPCIYTESYDQNENVTSMVDKSQYAEFLHESSAPPRFCNVMETGGDYSIFERESIGDMNWLRQMGLYCGLDRNTIAEIKDESVLRKRIHELEVNTIRQGQVKLGQLDKIYDPVFFQT